MQSRVIFGWPGCSGLRLGRSGKSLIMETAPPLGNLFHIVIVLMMIFFLSYICSEHLDVLYACCLSSSQHAPLERAWQHLICDLLTGIWKLLLGSPFFFFFFFKARYLFQPFGSFIFIELCLFFKFSEFSTWWFQNFFFLCTSLWKLSEKHWWKCLGFAVFIFFKK